MDIEITDFAVNKIRLTVCIRSKRVGVDWFWEVFEGMDWFGKEDGLRLGEVFG